MKIFTKIGQVLDEAVDELGNAFGEAVDKTWEESKKIHVESKKKIYNHFNDTTTIYIKYKKNDEVIEEFTVNGRKVDPKSEEAKKIRDSITVSSDAMDKGFEAMDEGFKAMDKAFNKMGKMFDRMFD